MQRSETRGSTAITALGLISFVKEFAAKKELAIINCID